MHSESVTAFVISICKSLKRQPIRSKPLFFQLNFIFFTAFFLT